MRDFLVLSLMVLCSLLVAPAGAQMTCVPGDRPIDPDYERDSVSEWPREAQRFKGNEQLVSRQRDRLRLALDGGKSTELVDCPYGSDAYHYLYERYDQAGSFHVVRKWEHEDFSYNLVMMPTGRVFTVYGAPVWASDKSRFLTVACSLQPPRGSLVIQAPADEGLATEAEFPLPCEAESCSARWDLGAWISVTCVPRGVSGKKGSEFVLIRNKDGAWNRFGR
jgi:hypothetical protein